MAERVSTMDELDVAEAMVKGDLGSPQRYGEFYLFDIRITGTGLAYRMGRKEFVWRDKALYHNDRFLKRTNGLPVIFDHPTEKPALDSKEFNARIVGTVFIPYIKDEDVWAIVKIYDEPTVELMQSEQMSTSPAVVFRASTSDNETVELDNGETLLIEGKPALLDHIAICAAGVWDKGGPPTGVAAGAEMADEKEKEAAAADKARHDAEEKDAKRDAMMDAVMDSFKRMDSRLDAFEKDRKDAKRHDGARRDKFGKRRDGESYKDWKGRHDEDMRSMCDALRKDSDESEEDCMSAAKDARRDAEDDEMRSDKDFEKWAKEEEKEPEHKEDKKDSDEKKDEVKEVKERETNEEEESKKDSALVRENTEMKLRLAALESQIKGIKRETPRAEIDALAAAQSRADGVAAMFGDRAPPPIAGETPLDYRKRLVGRFKRHSPKFKETRLDSHDEATLGAIEDIVYMDALNSARAPGDVTPGVLVPYMERDRAGREITRYHGDVGAFIAPFVPQEAQMVKLIRQGRN